MINSGAHNNLVLLLGAVVSPVGTPTSMAGANEISPAPAPGTSDSASLTATAFVSLVFALVVSSSYSI